MCEYLSEFLFKDTILINHFKGQLNLHVLALIGMMNRHGDPTVKLYPDYGCLFERAKSYYLLIVFGSGVLLLSIQSGQPCLSPRIRAGTAQWLVCRTLPTGVIPKSNTFSTQCYFI